MNPPSAADVRLASRLNFGDPDIGYPAPQGSGDDLLDPVVVEATSYVTFVTARKYDASVPDLLVSIMEQVARMRTEQLVQEGKADSVDTVSDFDMITSFTAGTYSENRRTMADANEAKAGMLNPWPALNRMLWLLLTPYPGDDPAIEDRLEFWRWFLGIGAVAPAWQTVEVAWEANSVFGSPVPGLTPVPPPGFPYGY